jgi:RNA recognition motif-containing protein
LFNDVLFRVVYYFLLPLQKKCYQAFREILFFKEECMQGSKLYVGNFSYSTTDTQLEELFGEFGEVKSATVIGDKGFGFVEMSSTEEAEKAKEALNETEFGGRTLRVDEARPQKPRTDRNFGGRY